MAAGCRPARLCAVSEGFAVAACKAQSDSQTDSLYGGTERVISWLADGRSRTRQRHVRAQRFVQGSAATGDRLAAVVRRELLADFREHNLSVEERAEGRFGSDGASFSQKGIATMGLYTGAGGPKSEIQASLFGGTADRPYDPCYHRACDTIENIDRDVLEQNTRALVRALNAAAIAAKR